MAKKKHLRENPVHYYYGDEVGAPISDNPLKHQLIENRNAVKDAEETKVYRYKTGLGMISYRTWMVIMFIVGWKLGDIAIGLLGL